VTVCDVKAAGPPGHAPTEPSRVTPTVAPDVLTVGPAVRRRNRRDVVPVFLMVRFACDTPPTGTFVPLSAGNANAGPVPSPGDNSMVPVATSVASPGC
jgi:hypothetical protein